ncbi:MAG: hypothetical protein AUI89_01895 [Gemmatimonadetes bacterium 13_1_40CM_3_65_8]|nr:MAG: hypothetical protein AUH75_08015 [Gemmatimonadetes bacterium 13_1_40CM_4_65_7]OLD03127.1 MAG: hypothetical protein AUI89_01895 [Gemmatimonadetes bacterium 13_1_40CM_3_65_8]
MNIDSIRRAIRFAGLVLPLTWAPGSMAGQMRAAQAQSFGVGVTTATVNQQAPSAVLPAGGTMAQDQASNVSIADMVTAQDAFAIVAGDGTDASDAVSSATLGQVSILNGLITADGIVAMASSTVDGGGANSNAEGSSLANLVVNGVQVSDPAPNTRMDLPGVGYVVFNEQIPTGDGVTSSGITVNMIHVVLQQLGLFGYETTGEIIVGSASSGVN